LMLRGIVEHNSRVGSGFDVGLLTAIGEQPTLQHYDVADRDRTRVTALLQVTPASVFAMSVSAAGGKDAYTGTGFGLRNNDNRTYTVTADVTPIEAIRGTVSYSYERYAALQTSRDSAPGPTFSDETRDWSIDSADAARTVAASLDLLRVVPKTELRLSYNLSRSKAAYVYGAPSDSTLAEMVQLPSLMSELQTTIADLRYFLTPKVALGVVYSRDRYRVDDFAFGPDTLTRIDMPGSLFLGSVYRPYTANSALMRVIYFW
jgi:hypothetical protein